MKDSRIVPKALSALTLLVVGGAGAGAAMASPASTGDGEANVLISATRISSLNDLTMAEFEVRSAENGLVALAAGGHHDDSIGSHHHHEAAAVPVTTSSAAQGFNV